MTETQFDVGMTCEGCASAVKRILGKIDGVTDVQTDVAAKKVTVQADPSVSPQLMLEKLQKIASRQCLNALILRSFHKLPSPLGASSSLPVSR